jgi:uncharacterized protein YuzE
MSSEFRLDLAPSDDEFEQDSPAAYLYLPSHPGAGTVGACEKIVKLGDLVSYKGPDIYLEFDKEGTIIGIEVN